MGSKKSIFVNIILKFKHIEIVLSSIKNNKTGIYSGFFTFTPLT